MPFVGIAVAHAGQIRTGTLGTPLERVVVHRLRCQRVVTVTLDLVLERADHLAVTDIAAFTHVDVATGQFERRVGTHPLDLLDGVLEVEERCDFHNAADGHDQQGTEEQKAGVLLEDLVFIKNGHC